VQQYVGVAVSDKVLVVRNYNPAQAKHAAWRQPMRIVSQSNP
jgi:hypothetical protein